MKLRKQDYIDILNYYEISYSKDLPISLLKKMTEKIISEKLCRCIKKVPNPGKKESRVIGICNNSVVKKKQLRIYKFSCKKKPQLKLKKTMQKGADKIYKIRTGRLLLNTKNKKTKKMKGGNKSH